jgi:hypothetical protein
VVRKRGREAQGCAVSFSISVGVIFLPYLASLWETIFDLSSRSNGWMLMCDHFVSPPDLSLRASIIFGSGVEETIIRIFGGSSRGSQWRPWYFDGSWLTASNIMTIPLFLVDAALRNLGKLLIRSSSFGFSILLSFAPFAALISS